MRKLLLGPAVAAALFGAMAGISFADPLKIAIANFGEHPQLSAAIEGFKGELAKEGYKDGIDVTYTIDHVNFDATLVPQMLSKIQAQMPDLVLTVTTPVSQMAKKVLGNDSFPLVFVAVTDPVAAGLVPSWKAGDANMTGASDLQDVDSTLAFIKKLLPEAKTVGIPFSPSEANDVALVNIMKEKATAHGLSIAEVGIDSANDIPQRVASLGGNADVIYVPTSNLINPAIGAVASAAKAAGIPVVSADEGVVKKGVVPASFSVSNEKIGQSAGKIAVRVLKGEKAPGIAPFKPSYDDHSATISKAATEAFGMKIPDSFAKCGCVVE